MKYGFIGTGNMANAIIGGMIGQGLANESSIWGFDQAPICLEKIKDQYGIHLATNNREVATVADMIFLAVKPHFYSQVIKEIKDYITEQKILISLAPGKTLEWFAEQFGKPIKIVRTMPNTPALVGAGMTGVCANEEVNSEELEAVLKVFRSFGKAEVVTEHLLDAVVTVSGSSPAYIFMLIEAMADAAVAEGMSRASAYEFAAQAVYGSAKMVLETGKHPGELKDMVCSPGGSTIEAVRVLEEKGFRSAVMAAMKACGEKSRRM